MSLRLYPVPGVPEVAAGDDLAALVVRHVQQPLVDGDVVVVTSKVVSKAAGLVVAGDREDLLAAETDRVVATRGPLRIVRTRHGLVLAAAGIDRSNTPLGTSVPLPPDPDGDARRIRARLRGLSGATVGVIVTDTAGRAWREGQSDLAVGVAGLRPLVPHAGLRDAHGNELAVTAPAVADEVAAAADLVAGKLGGVPVVVVRGLDPAYLLRDDGPGAAALVRGEDGDLFGLGAVDAVRAALRRGEQDARGFPAAAPDALARVVEEVGAGVRAAVRLVDGRVEVVPDGTEAADLLDAGAAAERVRVLAAAHRLRPDVEVLRG